MERYVCVCFLHVLNLAACLATFLGDNPDIRKALKYNVVKFKIKREATDTSWRPMSKWERKDAANNPAQATAQCRNIFYASSERFRNAGLEFEKELQFCGTHQILDSASNNNGDFLPNAAAGEYPWTAYIVFGAKVDVEFTDPDRGADRGSVEVTNYCTGSIIHQQFILTAGHCVATRVKNMYENMVLKSPDNPEREQVQSKYRDWLNELRGENKLLDTVEITRVSAQLTQIAVYYGRISIDRETGAVSSHDYDPIIIGDGISPIPTTNVKVHDGFIGHAEFVEMEKYRGIDGDLPKDRSPRWSVNDAAIIYLGKNNIIEYELNAVVPVCLPGTAGGTKENFHECSLQFKEVFYVAGHGVTDKQDENGLRTEGLSRARYMVSKAKFSGWRYYCSVYAGTPLSEHAGDTGAPWLAERVNQLGTSGTESRTFAMAIVSEGFMKREDEPGQDTLMMSDWIADTIIGFHTGSM